MPQRVRSYGCWRFTYPPHCSPDGSHDTHTACHSPAGQRQSVSTSQAYSTKSHFPLAGLPSFACAVEEGLAAALRGHEPPVLAVVRDGRTLLDCRTLTDAEADEVAAAVHACRSR